MQVNQNALVEIAADRDIGAEALRVFLYLNGRLDFENLIAVPQVEVAEALGMTRQSVNRAIKLLVAKGIIVRASQTGRGVTALRLNPHYGWKGKVKNLRQARQTRLQLVEPTPNREKMRTPPANHRRRPWRATRWVFKPSDVDFGFGPCITMQYGTAWGGDDRPSDDMRPARDAPAWLSPAAERPNPRHLV
jgi:biotin operon repressor